MNSFHLLKKEFWDDVGFGLFASIMLAGVLFLGGIVLSILWWIVSHGFKGLLVVVAITSGLYILNLIGKVAQRV